MKKYLKFTAFLLAFIMILETTNNLVFAVSNELLTANANEKVVFGVLSDIHLGGDKNNQAQRTEDSIRKLRELGAESIFINGDLTEWGRDYEYDDLKKVLDKFKAENYPVYATMGNHDYLTAALSETSQKMFRNATGNEPFATYEVNGYQFIMISPEKTLAKNDNYDKANKYLETALKEASEKSNGKPIFVFAHHPVPNTYYSSESWAGQLQKTPFLNYPNVVLFGGHNHPTNQLPNMIWQDEFTAISVPSIQYSEFPAPTGKPENSSDQMQGLLVEVEGDKVNVKTWDFRTNQWTNQEWEFESNGEKIYKDMKDKVKAPSFNGKEDIVELKTTENSLEIQFKQPKTPEGELIDNPVFRYHYSLSEKGSKPTTSNELTKFYNTPIPETITKTFNKLKPNTDYILTIQGEDIFGNMGDPLNVEFSTYKKPDEPAEPSGDYKVRFGVISDTHVKQGEDIRNKERTRNALNFMKKEDTIATFIVGDVTDQGREGEYINLKEVLDDIRSDGYTVHLSIGNHDAAKNLFDKNKYNERFTNFTGETPNAHHIINGYHFIMVSPDTDADNSYSPKTKKYLKDELAKAKANTGDKPIFVFFHHPVKDTFFVSNEWNGGIGKDIFKEYPMAVTFSGHIHSPNNHPRSIWQGSKDLGEPVFTTVNTVTVNYFEMEKGYSNGDTETYPYLHEEGQQGLVVEADGSLVTIKNYDFRSNQWIEQVWTFDTSDPDNFPYTNKRYDEAKAPYFENDDDVKVDVLDNKVNISITQAKVNPESVEGDIVYSYELDLFRGDRKDRKTTKIWSNFHLIPMPKTVEFSLDNLKKDTEYTLKVTPVDAFDKKGEPIEVKFDTFDKHTLTFNADPEKGTIDGENTIKVGIGSNLEDVTAPKVSAKEGYKFLGWDPELKGEVNSDMVFTAKFEKIKVEPVETEETEVEKVTIPFKTKYEDDSTLEKGKTRVKQEGKDGEKEIIKTYKVIDGKRQENPTITEKITKSPVDKIILVGTKVVEPEEPIRPTPLEPSIPVEPVETEETEVEKVSIPFKTKYEDDSTLEKGKTRVKQEGIDGEKEITKTYKVIDGKRQENPTITEKIIKAPVDKIILVGTKVVEPEEPIRPTPLEPSIPVEPVETEETEVEKVSIPFKTKYEDDSTLEKGKTRVKQEGIDGEKEITKTYKVIDGKRQENPTITEKIIKAPVDKIILVGTKVVEPEEPIRPTPLEPSIPVYPMPTPLEPSIPVYPTPTPLEPSIPVEPRPEYPSPIRPDNSRRYNPFVSEFFFGNIATSNDAKPADPKPVSPKNIEITDITGHWAEKPVREAVNKGYMELDNGKFFPNVDATRLGYVKALAKLAKVNPADYMNKTVLNDVKAGTTDAGYVNWAYEKGIIKGTGEGDFEGDRNITRQEIATILNRYEKAMNLNLSKKDVVDFSDNDKIADWAKEDVKEAHEKGIFNGKDNNMFDPISNITRAEVAQVVVNMDR